MTEPATKGDWFHRVCNTVIVPHSVAVVWLQSVTILWMLLECGVALFAASRAHSPALLAFGSDSLIELLSAAVVLLQFVPRLMISEQQATRAAAFLLFALAAIVVVIATLSLMGKVKPEASPLGIGITAIALLIMPVLGWLKRREAGRLHNSALAADAVQSATCAYLAAITLTGLGTNAIFHIEWFDSAAALLAVPLLIIEGRKAWGGHGCACC